MSGVAGLGCNYLWIFRSVCLHTFSICLDLFCFLQVIVKIVIAHISLFTAHERGSSGADPGVGDLGGQDPLPFWGHQNFIKR